MSGFCTSAARLGAPDTGLISYAEMVDTVRGDAVQRTEMPARNRRFRFLPGTAHPHPISQQARHSGWRATPYVTVLPGEILFAGDTQELCVLAVAGALSASPFGVASGPDSKSRSRRPC
jgi:hypothetical protein